MDRPNLKDTIALEKFRTPPNTVGDLRSLLGFFGYYRNYVPNFSNPFQPIDIWSSQDTTIDWEGQRCWSEIKTLQDGDRVEGKYADCGRWNYRLPEISSLSLGVLYQKQDSVNKIISFAPRRRIIIGIRASLISWEHQAEDEVVWPLYQCVNRRKIEKMTLRAGLCRSNGTGQDPLVRGMSWCWQITSPISGVIHPKQDCKDRHPKPFQWFHPQVRVPKQISPRSGSRVHEFCLRNCFASLGFRDHRQLLTIQWVTRR